MYTLSVVLVFLLIIITMALFKYHNQWSWPVVRPRIEATWPMFPNQTEGFANMTIKEWLPSPEVLVKPVLDACPASLMNAAKYDIGMKQPYKSYDLLSDGKKEPRIAIGPTSEQCYNVDWSRGLEPGGSYAQRTNNYKQNYPDSCSAPNHDLVLDFYIPKPSDGPYKLPKV